MNSLVLEYCNSEILSLKKVKDFYSSLINLKLAIENAANGINHKHVMDEHQYHIGYKNTNIARIELFKYYEEINNSEVFENIFEITDKVKKDVNMIGPLWSYDTALRLGFYKGIYPEKVYLQRGARDGARKLLNVSRIYGRTLDKNIFVKKIYELEKLHCYEIENFLCVFKNRF